MAIRLHIIPTLQNKLAVSADDGPQQAASEWAFAGAVADAAAGVGVRRSAEVLEVVVAAWSGDVMGSDVDACGGGCTGAGQGCSRGSCGVRIL